MTREISPSPNARAEDAATPISSPSKPTLKSRSISHSQDERPLSFIPTDNASQSRPPPEATDVQSVVPSISQDTSEPNQVQPSIDAASESPERDPFQDSTHALTDSNQVSRQT